MPAAAPNPQSICPAGPPLGGRWRGGPVLRTVVLGFSAGALAGLAVGWACLWATTPHAASAAQAARAMPSRIVSADGTLLDVIGGPAAQPITLDRVSPQRALVWLDTAAALRESYEPLADKLQRNDPQALAVMQLVQPLRQQVQAWAAGRGHDLARDGLTIHTTLDLRLPAAAQAAMLLTGPVLIERIVDARGREIERFTAEPQDAGPLALLQTQNRQTGDRA